MCRAQPKCANRIGCTARRCVALAARSSAVPLMGSPLSRRRSSNTNVFRVAADCTVDIADTARDAEGFRCRARAVRDGEPAGSCPHPLLGVGERGLLVVDLKLAYGLESPAADLVHMQREPLVPLAVTPNRFPMLSHDDPAGDSQI